MANRLDPKVAEKVMLKAGFKPLEPYKSALSNWKCLHLSCGETVFPRYNSIQQGRGGCLTCGHLIGKTKTRLSKSELNSRLKRKQLKLIGEYETVDKPFKIQCLICRKYSETTISTLSKKSRGEGCEKCRRQTAGLLPNKVATEEMIKKGLTPLEAYKSYKTPWLCKCKVCKKVKKISRESVRRRSIQFQGCSQCAKKSQDKKRIKDSEEIVLKRFRDKNLKLTGAYIKASQAVEVECLTCGHTFETMGLSLTRQKYSCAKCAGNYVNPIEAKKFMMLNGYKPKVEFPGAHTSWKSKHLLCGNDAAPSYTTIKSGNGGCKHCAKYGFQYSKPAYLYLITKPAINSHKIGIANPAKSKRSDRLYRFQYHGWQVFKIWNFKTGKVAEQVENLILLELRIKKKIPIYLSKAEMSGQGGHTETMSADSITLLELEKIIKKAIKGYRINP
jgi:hypothetical protein